MTLIDRTIEPVLHALAGKYPVITITGPRQSGKTTLCRKVFFDKPYANLESPDIRQFAMDDPRGFLAQYPDGAVLDEIQRAPDLVSYIQPMVDEDLRDGLFILTGSQQFEVSHAVNQSLAGRTALIKLLPFSMAELQTAVPLPQLDHHKGLFQGPAPYCPDFPRKYPRRLRPGLCRRRKTAADRRNHCACPSVAQPV